MYGENYLAIIKGAYPRECVIVGHGPNPELLDDQIGRIMPKQALMMNVKNKEYNRSREEETIW